MKYNPGSLFKRLLPVYAGFLAAVFVIYSKKCLHLINGNPVRTIAGILIMLIMLGLVMYLTISAVKREQINSLPAIETTAPKLTETQKLDGFVTFFRSAVTHNLGPFETKKKDFFEMCAGMKQKNENIRRLLAESFSPDDLTYRTYINTLDEVMRIFNSNLNGIKKRLEVFDYAEWNRDNNDEHATAYISEINNLYEKNYVVIDNMDDLMHELVQLDDISDVPLDKINRLVEQTQNYKKIKEEEWL
ncbi:MAG: hypothetical protein PUE12_17525 [Oscillospiraceae bacterium]|nr:hypothetical protein [Oscillospiraceae bacterium]